MEGITVTDVELSEIFDTNGYREETLAGGRYYVSRDSSGRAIIGPKRHRTTRRKISPPKKPSMVLYGAETDAELMPARGVAKVRTGWGAKLRKAWTDRFYDEEWHKAVQHLGMDVVIWVGGGSFTAILVKGAWWVVSL